MNKNRRRLLNTYGGLPVGSARIAAGADAVLEGKAVRRHHPQAWDVADALVQRLIGDLLATWEVQVRQSLASRG